MPRGNQLTRQRRLLQLIDRPAGIVVDDAARELHCAVRTIWRDLQLLQEAGFPIHDEQMADGRRSVWKVDETFKRRLPLKLTLPEVAARVLMSRELLGSGNAAVLGPAIRSSFEKIAGILSKDALGLIDRMRETIGVRAFGAKLHVPSAEHLAAIQGVLLDRRCLRLHYYSMSRDEITHRRVDPYHLTLHGGGFYLVGYCHRWVTVTSARPSASLPSSASVSARRCARAPTCPSRSTWRSTSKGRGASSAVTSSPSR